MPATINGFGTTLYNGRGDVGFGGVDAVEWVVALYIPLIPIKCVHTFNWQGNQYQQVPLRWSFALVVRSFLAGWRGWLLLIGIIAVVCALLGYLLGPEKGRDDVEKKYFFVGIMGIAAAVLLPSAGLAHLWLVVTDTRTNDIRRVLGPHELGNADPADLADPPPVDPQRYCETRTFAEAVDRLLERGDYTRAMWAARLSAALEDRATGEALTDQVLADARVAEALQVVRREPARWKDVMLPAE